jgi:predicted nucleic acid-binding protein
MALRSLPIMDGFLAATAKVHDLTLTTRNEVDFAGLPIPIENPFSANMP